MTIIKRINSTNMTIMQIMPKYYHLVTTYIFTLIVMMTTASNIYADVDNSENSNITTEENCQKQYQLSCERVLNWKQYALEKCGNDARCKDDDYLDRKYRPRTLKELQAIARRAGTRKNRQEDDIASFLKRNYTNYCQRQASLSCQVTTDMQCSQKVLNYCQDSRNLDDLFTRYNSLTVSQKQTIIKQAKKLSSANGLSQYDYDRMLINLLELYIKQALIGM